MSMKLKKQVKQLLADDTTQGTDISGLKTTVGDSSKGLVKDTADLKTAVGADDTAGLKKRCKDIETEIGTDDTAAIIKGRLYALEHPANGDS